MEISIMKGALVTLVMFFASHALAASGKEGMGIIYFPEDAQALQLPRPIESRNNAQNSSENKSHDPSVISFAWKLFQGSKLASPVNNLVLSPVVLQYLLAILETAAEGETKAQLRRVIGTQDARSFIPLLSSPARTVQLESAGGIFLDSSQTLNRKFSDYVRSLGTEIASLDFKNYPDQSRNAINRWASLATHGTINDLLSPAYDIQAVEVIITSAIYFHSAWKYTFNRTNPEIFYTYTGSGKPAEFMEAKQSFVLEHIDLGHGIEGDLVEIPYEGEDYCMLIIVPSANVTLDEFIRNLNTTTFEQIIKTTPDKFTRPITLRMPKFKIQTRFSVVNALLKMGVVDLFTLQSRLPHMGLKGDNRINDILQEATLMVDENGTIASAATASFLIPLSAVQRQDLIFTVNKPFLSVIVDKSNQMPLFISKIYQPIY